MMETKTLTCINCPLGCTVTVQLEDGEIREITGNTCKRGAAYVRQEVTAPARMVTTTLRVRNGAAPTVPVKTEIPIPKDQVLACVQSLKGVLLAAPVLPGQKVAEFSGVALLAVKAVDCL